MRTIRTDRSVNMSLVDLMELNIGVSTTTHTCVGLISLAIEYDNL